MDIDELKREYDEWESGLSDELSNQISVLDIYSRLGTHVLVKHLEDEMINGTSDLSDPPGIIKTNIEN